MKNILLAGLMLLFSCMEGEAQSGLKRGFSKFSKYTVCSYDERAGLTLYKSCNGGKTWDNGLLLYEKASGYSCVSLLPDGRMAIIFETADTQSFTRKSLPDMKPLKRPVG